MITRNDFRNNTFIMAIIGAFVLFGAGCDSGVDATSNEDSVTVSGQVSEDENDTQNKTYGKMGEPSAETLTSVEGAVVTAVAVHADGSVSELNGETTTNANGEFTLVAEGEGAADYIRVFARGDGDFEASSIVQVDGQNSVDSRPLTAESHARARVYLEAKARDGYDSHYEGVTAADVAVFTNDAVAAEINAGVQSAADVGTAIASAVKAQVEFNAKASAEVAMSAIFEARAEAFAQFHSDLASSSSAEARANAYTKLEGSYINVFTDNGTDVETQAKFHQTSASILVEASSNTNGKAELGLRKQAELILSKATALSIEAMFQAEGASSSTIDALIEARTVAVSEIREASSIEAIVNAKADYKAKVDAETESHFGISSSARASAEAEIESSVDVLQNVIASLSIFGNVAEATAEAYNSFYLDAQLNAKTSFEANGMAEAEAEAAANITVMTSVMTS
ncbi:MAG: hypothetical protein WD267_05705 [Balneolales bacterium]